MDVLNLSLGGPQIDPSADALALALANAARMGVPSVVAAGNDFDTRGYGSISSPGTIGGRDHGRRDVDARASSESAGTASGSTDPALTPFTAVPSIGPRVTRRAHAADAARRPGGLRARPRAPAASPAGADALRAVVIVLRGGCGFGAKAINAHEAGALAVIVESDRPGPPFVVEEQADIPLLVVTDVVGRGAARLHRRRGRGARVRFTRSDRRAADAAARADGLLVRRPDAVRPAAQARHRGARRGDPLVRPAGLARLSGRLRLVGGHVDGRAGGHGRRRADARAPSRSGRPRRSARR